MHKNTASHIGLITLSKVIIIIGYIFCFFVIPLYASTPLLDLNNKGNDQTIPKSCTSMINSLTHASYFVKILSNHKANILLNTDHIRWEVFQGRQWYVYGELQACSHPEVQEVIDFMHSHDGKIILIEDEGSDGDHYPGVVLFNNGNHPVLAIGVHFYLGQLRHEWDHIKFLFKVKEKWENLGLAPNEAGEITTKWANSPIGLWQLERSALKIDLKFFAEYQSVRTGYEEKIRLARSKPELSPTRAIPFSNLKDMINRIIYPELEALNVGISLKKSVRNNPQLEILLNKIGSELARKIFLLRRAAFRRWRLGPLKNDEIDPALLVTKLDRNTPISTILNLNFQTRFIESGNLEDLQEIFSSALDRNSYHIP